MKTDSCTHECRDCALKALSKSPFLCRCIKVTVDQIEEAVSVFGATSVLEVRKVTGAGGGCRACQRKIQAIIDRVLVPVPAEAEAIPA